MEIPINTQVECTDGVCGRSAYVLINPVLGQVTHLVVKEASSNKERIVPIDLVSETISDTILLRCSKEELAKMEPFVQTRFIVENLPEYAGKAGYGTGTYFYWPYSNTVKKVYESIKYQQIPPGEMAIYRGTRVEATDGFVGKVDEFVVNPDNCHITHLVMREGHLWGQKDVIIPVSEIRVSNEETVHLKLNKQQIESLPTFPVHRRWS